MVQIKTLSGNETSKIGIGTWGVGGRGHRDVPVTDNLDDSVYIDAIAYSLRKGCNFTEVALGYGHGLSLKLLKQALDKSLLKREDVFLTHSLYARDLDSVDTVRQDIADFYTVMATKYADSTLVEQPTILKIGKDLIYQILHELIDKGKTRYVSLSNANPNLIRNFRQEFGDKFIAHDGHLSFEVRALQDKGVFETCDSLGVANNIWRPIRKGKTLQHNWPLLVELSDKYSRTQVQIILNWMCHLGYHPMVFSINQSHIDENLAAIDFEMGQSDYERMSKFRPKNYHPPKVNWGGQNITEDMVILANEFEQHIAARKSDC